MNALDRLDTGRLTFGVELPLDNDWSPAGRMKAEAEGRAFGVPEIGLMPERVKLAEALGFDAVWVRDVPVHDPEFGDAGQLYDPFTLLGYLAGRTSQIVLGAAAIVVPLRDPIHLAKITASVHRLSQERFILGVASGDRPVEYPLMGLSFEQRGDTLRTSLDGPRGPATVQPFVGEGPPVVMARMGQQSLQWIAAHTDGWFTYPGPPDQAGRRLAMWRKARGDTGLATAPVLTAMMLDLADDPEEPEEPFSPIRLGARLGRKALIEHLCALHDAGVAPLSFNFRQSRRPVEEVLQELSTEVLPRLAEQEAI